MFSRPVLLGWACCLALAAPLWPAEELVIGNADRPWAESGSAVVGVVDYVDRLASIQDEAGLPLFSEADSLTGWITPLRLLPDFNISRDLVARGGTVDVNLPSDQVPEEQLLGILDGDHIVAFDRKFIVGRVVQNNGVVLSLDLGARFGVNRIIFYPRLTPEYPFAGQFLRAFELYVNDGLPQSLYASGQPIYTSPAVRRPDNSEVRVEAHLDAQFVRFLRLKSITTVGFEIDELEVYGTGFVPEARYQTRVIDLGEPRIWGTLRFVSTAAGLQTDSDLEVRMRSGRDRTPDVYYRTLTMGTRIVGRTVLDEKGDTLTQASYEAMRRAGGRGEVEGDADNWGQWQIVDHGHQLELPAPRQYVQLRIDFSNRSLEAARALGEIRFTHVAPVVDELVAEIAPSMTEAGQPTTFTYVVRVANPSVRPGFERFSIETPSRVLAVRSIEVFDSQLQRIAAAEFPLRPDWTRLPLRVGSFAIERVEEGRFTIRVPAIRDDGARLRIVFDASAYRYGTRFEGRALADSLTGLSQVTVPGDASPELDTNGLLVRVSTGSAILAQVAIEPAGFSPNGDGINDQVTILCTLLHLLEAAPVRVVVLDLAGRPVRHLVVPPAVNGRIEVIWDGRDDEGALALPGLYLVHAEVQSDAGTERRIRQVVVAY